MTEKAEMILWVSWKCKRYWTGIQRWNSKKI